MTKQTTLYRLLAVWLISLPGAFGYIGQTITSGSSTIQITRADGANLQFYLNNLVAAGATSSLVGTASPVFTASSNPTSAIETAMANWNNVGAASIHFNALLPTTAGANSGDCVNVISMAGSAADLSLLGYVSPASPGVVAVTANAYVAGAGSVCGSATSIAAGTIFDSDIVLNPYLQFSTNSAANTKDVQAVLTHEIGHVLGMNHSALLAAAMYPYSFRYERHISWDEKAFAATYYPSGAKSLGTISGTVTLSGAPVKFGLVTLTDLTQPPAGGKVIGALTAADGTYSVQVPAGTYNVYAEPFNSFIAPANLYSLSTATGTLNPTQVTTGFQATFSGGNTTSPPVFTVTAGSSSTANISVISGATPLALPYYAIGTAGGNGFPVGTLFSSISNALTFTGGTSVDIAFAGPGIDSTIQVVFIGTDVTLVGTPRVDTSGTLPISGTQYPIIRQTLQIGSQTNSTIGTLWIVKGTNILPLTGLMDIEPIAPFVSNVLDAESARPSFVSGQYGAIYGSGLSNNTRTWNANTDFTGGVTAGNPLPTSLDGVSVTVNGLAASVFSISPTQINFIAPTGLTGGTHASVVVNNGGTSSSAFTGSNIASQASPSFFYYGAGTTIYPAAVRLSDGKLVGDPAVLGGTEKALPNDTLIMFGNGLTAEPGGVIATVAGFSGPVTITGTSGANSFTAVSVAAALVYAGEFQINVTLPANIPSGNYALTMAVPGASTSTSGISVILPVGP